MKDSERLKRYQYHVVYHGAPYGDNETGHIDFSSNCKEKCYVFISKREAKYYGNNGGIYHRSHERFK